MDTADGEPWIPLTREERTAGRTPKRTAAASDTIAVSCPGEDLGCCTEQLLWQAIANDGNTVKLRAGTEQDLTDRHTTRIVHVQIEHTTRDAITLECSTARADTPGPTLRIPTDIAIMPIAGQPMDAPESVGVITTPKEQTSDDDAARMLIRICFEPNRDTDARPATEQALDMLPRALAMIRRSRENAREADDEQRKQTLAKAAHRHLSRLLAHGESVQIDIESGTPVTVYRSFEATPHTAEKSEARYRWQA